MRAAALVFVLAALARAQGETRRYESEDEQVSLELPASWDDVQTRKGQDAIFVLDVDVGRARMYVYRLAGMRNARAQAFYEQDSFGRNKKNTAAIEVHLEPIPHMIRTYIQNHRKHIYAAAYSMHKRLGYAIAVDVPEENFAKVKAAWLLAAQSFRATTDEWPPRPAGVKEVIKDGWVYLVGNGVKPNAIARLHKVVKKREKAFAKVYGPVLKPPDNAPQIAVFAQRAHSPVPIEERGTTTKHLERRIYAVPFAKGDTLREADFAMAVVDILAMQSMDGIADWPDSAEATLGWSAHRCGKPLPYLPNVVWKDIPSDLATLAEIAAPESKVERRQGLAYLLLFRMGPAKYRKAFAAYVADYRRTGDSRAALRKHLLSLDPEQLEEEARKTVARVKIP